MHNIDLYLQRCRKLAEKKQQHKNKQKKVVERKPEQTLLSFFHSKLKVRKVSTENIEVLEDIAFENRTLHENDIAEKDDSPIKKLLEDSIEKVCEPEVDKPDTHDRVEMSDKDVKIDESS